MLALASQGDRWRGAASPNAAAIHPSGVRAWVDGYGCLLATDASGTVVAERSLGDDAASAELAFSPDGHHLALIGVGRVEVLGSDFVTATLDTGAAIADVIWSGDGALLATLERDTPIAWVWSADGSLRTAVHAGAAPIRSIAFDRERGRMALAAPDGILSSRSTPPRW